MTPSTSSRFVRSVGAFFLLVTCTLPSCNRAAPPAEEKLPPAPVKWEGIRQLFLEEWTELVGTTQPLPDHAARVTAPVEGRVVSVLQGGSNKPIVEGQPVEKGAVLAQLDATVIIHKREAKAEEARLLQHEKDMAELGVQQAELDVRKLKESTTQLVKVSPFEVEK